MQSVERMARDGVGSFVEVGPGKVLSKMIKRINPQLQVANSEQIIFQAS